MLPIELPGRNSRRSEPPETDLKRLAHQIAGVVQDELLCRCMLLDAAVMACMLLDAAAMVCMLLDAEPIVNKR